MLKFLVDVFYEVMFFAEFGHKIPLSKYAVQDFNTDGFVFLFTNELSVILTQEARDLIGNAHYRTRVSIKGIRDYTYTIQFARKADAAMFTIAFFQ